MTYPTGKTWHQIIADWLKQLLWDDAPNVSFAALSYDRGDYDVAMLLQRLGYVVMSNDHVRCLKPPADCPFPTRWDDAMLVVLRTMEKRHLIRYPDVLASQIEAYRESYGVPLSEAALPPASSAAPASAWRTIGQTSLCAQAKTTPEAYDILTRLGLVSDAIWTDQAAPVIWRLWANMNPAGWPSETDLFKTQQQHCCDSMPPEIAAQIEELLSFSDSLLERKEAFLGDWADEEEVNRAAGQTNIGRVTDILQANWRFGDGWLRPEDQLTCFGPNFDNLAAEMAHALVTQQYPQSPLAMAITDTPAPRPMLH